MAAPAFCGLTIKYSGTLQVTNTGTTQINELKSALKLDGPLVGSIYSFPVVGSFTYDHPVTPALGNYAITAADINGVPVTLTSGNLRAGNTGSGGTQYAFAFSGSVPFPGGGTRNVTFDMGGQFPAGVVDTNTEPTDTSFYPQGTSYTITSGFTFFSSAGSAGGPSVWAGGFTPPAGQLLGPPPECCDEGVQPKATAPPAAVGDPIDTTTGNVFEVITDYATAGQNKLAFIRYYNSQGDFLTTFPTSLGQGWRNNYDRVIRIHSGTAVSLERHDGKVLDFALVSSVWTPKADIDVKLTNSGSTWTVTDSDDTIETYTTSGSKAVLDSIQKRGGYTQTLSYSSGKLQTVTDSYSRSLSFTYTGDLLNTVSTPDSLTLTFGFDASGRNPGVNDRLVSISYSTSPTTSQTYHYEEPGQSFSLTGITDENSDRLNTWDYDGAGRGLSAQRAGGRTSPRLPTVTRSAALRSPDPAACRKPTLSRRCRPSRN